MVFGLVAVTFLSEEPPDKGEATATASASNFLFLTTNRTIMSRKPQQGVADAAQQELEGEEVISGTGEGDEPMEDVEGQEEGYSTCLGFVYLTLCALRGPIAMLFRRINQCPIY